MLSVALLRYVPALCPLLAVEFCFYTGVVVCIIVGGVFVCRGWLYWLFFSGSVCSGEVVLGVFSLVGEAFNGCCFFFSFFSNYVFFHRLSLIKFAMSKKNKGLFWKNKA